MITFIPINNPRTPGKRILEDEEYGCHNCKQIAPAYIGIEFTICGMNLAMIKLCKECLINGENIINDLMSNQMKKGVL